MQELRPRDMSLPDRIGVLERSLERERNKRKMLEELVGEIAEYLEVTMKFLDGAKRNGFVFKKEAIKTALKEEV